MFHPIVGSSLRCAVILSLSLAIAFVAVSLTPRTSAAADPAVYEMTTSAGRTCRAEVDIARSGGFLVLHRIEFDTAITCDDTTPQEPTLAGGTLQLRSVETEPLNVVFGIGERTAANDYGYSCALNTTPCTDAGENPLGVVGTYYAESLFFVELPQGETWDEIPANCITLSDTVLSCALRSPLLPVTVL